jgi:hypothetical protein
MESFLANRTVVRSANGVPDPDQEPDGFQPLIPQPHARGLTSRMDREIPKVSDHAGSAPQVEWVEENGRIARIIVTCSCCQRIELACDY